MTQQEYREFSQFIKTSGFPYCMDEIDDKNWILAGISNWCSDNGGKKWYNDVKAIIQNNTSWCFDNEQDVKAFLNSIWQLVDTSVGAKIKEGMKKHHEKLMENADGNIPNSLKTWITKKCKELVVDKELGKLVTVKMRGDLLVIDNLPHFFSADDIAGECTPFVWQYVSKSIAKLDVALLPEPSRIKQLITEAENQYTRLYRTWGKAQLEKEWTSTNAEYEKLLNDKNVDKKGSNYKATVSDLSAKLDSLEDYYQKLYDGEKDKNKKIKFLDNILKNKASGTSKNGAPTSKLGKFLGKVGDTTTKAADGAISTLKNTKNLTDKAAKAYFGEAKEEDFQFIILNPTREIQTTTFKGGKTGKVTSEPFDIDLSEPLIFNKFEDFCKRYNLNSDNFLCAKDGLITLSRLEDILGNEVLEDTEDYDSYISGTEEMYWVEYAFEIKFIIKTYPTQDEIQQKLGIKKI